MEVKKIEGQEKYQFKTYKTIKGNVGGEIVDVVVVDRVEILTIAQLNLRKSQLEKELVSVQAKLDAITNLT